MSYEINYNDERFQKVEADKKQALTENEKLYGGMVSESDKYYQAQIDASQQWADKQTQLQQEQTDFAIEKIEQQKEQAHKDYTREQSGAYVDWQKQSNNYGANAEQMATMGLTNTGYSESSQVQMYTAYQNRVATARESYNRAVVDYNNAITEARLQNNSILAEIAYEALQKKLELGLQGFQYKNTLLLDQANKKLEIDQMYHGRYQDVLNQMNTENALAEQVRQFNENLAEERRQYNETMAFNREQFNWQKSQASKSSGGGSSSSKKSSSSGGSTQSNKGNALNTEYYRGDYNPDGEKYGTFGNGYQPKGISGHGNVVKTGQTLELQTETLSGKKQTVVQNVWQTTDGAKWYWEGRDNEYKLLEAGGKGTNKNKNASVK